MKSHVSRIALLLGAAAGALAQTQAPVNFPAIPLPAAIAVFGEYNQLGSPKETGGVAAIYPVIGSVGIYGTTTADFFPKLAVDPSTGKQFWAVSSAVRQGFHKDLVDTGRWSFLLGGDVGPTISAPGSGAISLSFSSSFVATTIYQATPAVSFMAPVRMVYIAGVGWNPVGEFGIVINLRKLPAKKN